MTNRPDVRLIVKSENDPLFYTIPGFPGYEATKNGYIRSFKNDRKNYPYGYLLNCCDNGDTHFKLTNRNNQVVKISYQEILVLIAAESGHSYLEIPFNVSRNKRMGIHFEEMSVGEVVKQPRPMRKDNQKLYISDLFTSDSKLNSWNYTEEE